ncbi:hypothetical protein ADK34_02270 [Streptomyces viridochromogenes]|uniref:Uncharacterized protein n=1 Tax=Streptomyces viridochromogenes TaxID=1938 RepID=A0A0L8LDH3_STRVR|nr:hypothetical protein ADK34_02270 [Streptomyces viridochromogenes]
MGPCVQVPAEGVDALGQAHQPEAGRGGVLGRLAGGVDDLHHGGGRSVFQTNAHRCAGRVFAGVGQAFLDETVDRQPVSGRCLFGLAVDLEFDLLAGFSRLLDELLDVAQDGGGRSATGGGAALVQGSQHVAQVRQGFGGSGAQQREAFGDRGGQGVGAGGQYPGVQGDEAEAVGEDVVHLGGDAGTFRGPCRLLSEFSLDAQMLDLAAQCL